MTLKSRNRFTFFSSVLFLVISIFYILCFLYNLKRGIDLSDFSVFHHSLWTLLFAGIFLAVYIPLSSFYLYSRFEKTPSNEVAFFVLFLLGCLPEIFRVFIPFETVARNYPVLLVVAGRAIFWGRTLCFVSLFAGSICGMNRKSVNAEQNILVILIFSLVLAGLVPVNTAHIYKSFSVQIGFATFIYVLYVLIALLTFATYAMCAYQNENSSYLKIGINALLIESGLIILYSSTIMALVLPAVIMLSAGTFRYIRQLRRLYI